MPNWNYKNVTTQTTVTVAPAQCELIAVVVNTAAASAVCKVVENAGGGTAGNAIASIDASATGNFFYGIACRNGLSVVTSGGNADVTVVWAPIPEGMTVDDYYGVPLED
jgi:hypothetical protein